MPLWKDLQAFLATANSFGLPATPHPPDPTVPARILRPILLVIVGVEAPSRTEIMRPRRRGPVTANLCVGADDDPLVDLALRPQTGCKAPD